MSRKLTAFIREAWLGFWLGPVCGDCGKRHPRQLQDLYRCIAHRALDRYVDDFLRANGLHLRREGER